MRFFSSARRAGEIALSIVLLVGSLAFLYFATTISEPPAGFGVGPRVFPLLLGGILVVACAGLLLREIWIERRRKLDAGEDEGLVPLEDDDSEISDWPAVAFAIAALVAVLVLMEPLGFAIAVTGFMFALSTFFAPAKWVRNLVVAVVFSLFFSLLFGVVLGIRLPQGPLNDVFLGLL